MTAKYNNQPRGRIFGEVVMRVEEVQMGWSTLGGVVPLFGATNRNAKNKEKLVVPWP